MQKWFFTAGWEWRVPEGNQLYFHQDRINLHVSGQESFSLLFVTYKLQSSKIAQRQWKVQTPRTQKIWNWVRPSFHWRYLMVLLVYFKVFHNLSWHMWHFKICQKYYYMPFQCQTRAGSRSVVPSPRMEVSPGTCKKCQFFKSTPDLLNRPSNLVSQSSGWFWSTLNFWSTGRWTNIALYID